MTITTHGRRIAVLGLGAIGKRVLSGLQKELLPNGIYAGFDRPGSSPDMDGVERITSLESLCAWRPDLVVECAGHGVVSSVVPVLLRQGVDVILVSVGALSDDRLRADLAQAAHDGSARLVTVSGAIGGLDALDAARSAGLDSVVYTGRKPPLAWKDTPAEDVVDLVSLQQAAVIFEGTARGAAQSFPKNANVTAAVALAGVGFDATSVRLIADPTVDCNVHEVEARGAFGRFFMRLENNPLPDNVKTSWLAALSIEAELRKYLQIPSSI
ncbi:aspartate dehydrogenase [Comamonas humi]